ncbi:MAG: DUF2059 domain-containing protein [Loktanella sp.]|nr:DUF2059 domain-containing protein [Loktanella sp.]
MLRRVFLSLIASVSLATAAVAQTESDADLLFDAMGLPQIIGVMREEGLSYGETIARDMFPGGMTPRWAAAVAQVYDADVMTAEMRTAFVTALADQDLTPMLAFYQSDLGQQIVAQEISAREAMLDPALEAAAKQMAAEAARANTPRFQLIDDFIAANDLIEANVVGGLNSNYAFLSGLMSGPARIPGMGPETLLDDVWAQEPEIRASTTEWLYAFLMLSYEPLSDTQLSELIGFTQTAEGRVMTSALFTAFDQAFERVSYDLGSAASGFLIAQEL